MSAITIEELPKEFNVDEYTNLYESIQTSLVSCYLDRFLLEYYESQNEEKQRALSQHLIAHHVGFIVKQDLCLNLWKTCYDSGSNACTLQKLTNLLRKQKINVVYEKTECWKKLQKPISDARNKYLAHSDAVSVTGAVDVKDMKHLLEESRKILNSFCIERLGVKQLTDAMLSTREMYTVMDMNSLLKE